MKGTLVFLLIISLFLGFVLVGTAAGAIFPSIFRISSPLVCKDEMTIERRGYSYEPGQRGWQTLIYCQNETTGVKREITGAAVVVSCLIYSLMIFLAFCLNLLIKRLRGKQPEESQVAAAMSHSHPNLVASMKRNLATESPLEVMKELKELRDADLITEQEYQAKKAEILSKM